MGNAEKIMKQLTNTGIDYQLVSHPAVYTAAEADRYVEGYQFVRAKNLFLQDKHNFYLVVLPDEKRLDMKNLRKQLGAGRLSFAKEQDLVGQLGIKSGAVSPFNLINDKKHSVVLVLDEKITADQQIGCHPNDNTKTVILKVGDLLTLIRQWGNPVEVAKL